MLSLIIVQFLNAIKPSASRNDFPEVLKYRDIMSAKVKRGLLHTYPLMLTISIVLFICSLIYCKYAISVVLGLGILVLLVLNLLKKNSLMLMCLTEFLFSIFLVLVPPLVLLLGTDPAHDIILKADFIVSQLENKTAIFFFLGVFVNQLQTLSLFSGHVLLAFLQTSLIIASYTIIVIKTDELSILFFLVVFIHLYMVVLLVYTGCRKLENFFLKDSKLKQLKMFQFFVEKIETNSAFILSATHSNGDKPDLMEILSPGKSPLSRSQATQEAGATIPSKKSVSIEFKIDYQNQEAKQKYNFPSEATFFSFIDSLLVVNSREKSWLAYNMGSEHSMKSEMWSEEGHNLSSGKNSLLQMFKKTFLNKERLDYFEQNYGSPLKKKRKNNVGKAAEWSAFEKRRNSSSNGPATRMPQICFEYACISKDHQNHKLSVKVLPFMFDDKVSLFIFFHDISEKVQNEKLQALDKYKDQVLATVTHDLRSPLNVIMNSLDILASHTNIDEAAKKFITSGRVNGKLLNSLINDILDYAQIKEGKIRVNYELVAIEEIYRELKYMFDYQAKMKNIAFVIQYQPGIPTELFIDRDRLKQVLINLLTNAFKFTRNGRVKLRISYPRGQTEKDYLKIAVRDSGSGIPKAFIPRLFRPYATMNSKDNSNSKGIGLGLVICRNLVSIMGPFQKIFVRSREGVGTVFWFYIYFKKQPIQEEARLLKEKSSNDKSQDKNFLEDKITLLKVIGSKKAISDSEVENQDELSLDSDNLVEEDASIKRSDVPSIKSSSSNGQTEYITFNVSNSLASNSGSNSVGSNQFSNSNSGSNSSSGVTKSAFNPKKMRRVEVDKNYESLPENPVKEEEEEKTQSPYKMKQKALLRPQENMTTELPHNGIQGSIESIGLSNISAEIPEYKDRNNKGQANSFLQRITKSPPTIIVGGSKSNFIHYPQIKAPEKEDDDLLLNTYESQEEDSHDHPKKRDKYTVTLLGSNKNLQNDASLRFSEGRSTGLGHSEKINGHQVEAEPEGKFALLVDDDNFNHQIYQQQLKAFSKEHKIRLESRFDGQEAVEYVESLLNNGHPLPLFVIMDYEMPKMKGVEATRRIQNLCSLNGRDPINILGLTGNSRSQDIEDGISAGMRAVMTKPVSGVQLLDKIKNYI